MAIRVGRNYPADTGPNGLSEVPTWVTPTEALRNQGFFAWVEFHVGDASLVRVANPTVVTCEIPVFTGISWVSGVVVLST